MQIKDRSFLITGGSSGLGAACCRELVSTGARVMIADVNQEAAETLIEECGPGLDFRRTDVQNAEEMDAVIKASLEVHGPLHGLITCAGILRGSRVVGRETPHDLSLFQQIINVNLVGTFNAMRLAAAQMVDTPTDDDGERGVIITTSSIASWDGQIGQAGYAAAKGGVASMTLPVARELGQHGIRVVSIAPGIFDTPMMEKVRPAIRSSLEAQIPFPQRFGQPSEFAQLTRQVIENRMLNGTVIRLDAAVRMDAK